MAAMQQALMMIFIDDSAPTPTDPDFSSVLLLINNEDPSATFIDRSSYARTINRFNSVVHSTTNPKFGTQCALFTGDGTLNIPSDTAFNFPGKVTFEFWLRPESATTGDFFARRSTTDGNNFFLFRFNSNGTLRFVVKTGGAQTVDFSSAVGNALSLNTYHHVGLTRDDPTTPGTYDRWRIWANGSVIATQTVNFSFPTVAINLFVGVGDNSAANGFVGRMDSTRITSGVARDLSVVPTAEFPTS